jgi:hypothetical protein
MPDGQTRHSGPSLGPFDWADPFHLGDQLGEDERMVAESARSFAGDRLAAPGGRPTWRSMSRPRSSPRWARWAFWA